MNKLLATFALLLFLPTTNLYADESLSILKLKSCTSIKDDSKRLKCFDDAMKMQAPIKAEKLVSEIDNQETKNSQKIEMSTEEAFGKKESEINEMNLLRSHIVGPFNGWKKGATLTLANGQKWKVLSRSAGYVDLKDPKVEIERAMFGSFKMKVEGLNSAAKVKRIK